MKKILIVEDDVVVASAYRKKFTQDGFQVECAPDGLEGIKMVSSVKPDLVLLDLLMPKLDGIEVLKYIRAHPDLKNVAVVVFSNSYMTNLVERAWSAGADHCLMKASTTPAQLTDVVNKALQKATARAATPGAPVPLAAPVNPLARQAPAVAPAPPVAPLSRAAPPVVPIPREPQARVPSGTTAIPATAPVSGEKSAPSFHSEADPEFQAQVRQLFLSSATGLLGGISVLAAEFVQGEGSSEQLAQLSELFRKVHSFTGNAGLAGCLPIARFASTFEAFLKELQQKPKFINVSTLRTVADSVNFLGSLLTHALQPDPEPARPPAVLVVDSDAVSCQTIGLALEKADLSATMCENPADAVRLLTENRYDLVVLSADMSGLNGFELFARIRTLPAHAGTPVLLVSTLPEFARQSSLITESHADIIAKPFLLMELTIKAVMHLTRRELK